MDALSIMTDYRHLNSEVIFSLLPPPANARVVFRLGCWSQVEGANVSKGRSWGWLALAFESLSCPVDQSEVSIR